MMDDKYDLKFWTMKVYGEKIERLLHEGKFRVSQVGGTTGVCLPVRAYLAWLAFTCDLNYNENSMGGFASPRGNMVNIDRIRFPVHGVQYLYAVPDYKGYRKTYADRPWLR